MQREPRHRHAFRAQRIQQRLVEVQARGGRSNGAGIACIHGLVARLVAGIGGVRDVRRQRHLAMPLHHPQHLVVEAQLEEVVVPRDHLRLDTRRERDPAPGLERLARARLHQRAMRIEHPLHQHLHLAAAVLAAMQPRLHHARVVHDQHVVGRDEPRDVGKAEVFERAGRAVEVQEAARGALRRRMLRDQLGREGVVEVGELHPHSIIFDCSALPCITNLAGTHAKRRSARPTAGHEMPGWRNW